MTIRAEAVQADDGGITATLTALKDAAVVYSDRICLDVAAARDQFAAAAGIDAHDLFRVRETLREALAAAPSRAARPASESTPPATETQLAVREWPAPPDPAAYYGLAGEIVEALDPTTEADPVALLASLLAAVGNIVGPGPHWRVSGRRHGLRIYPVMVGPTAKGRKGTAWGSLRPILEVAAPDWLATHVATGLSSGEGLIWPCVTPSSSWSRSKSAARSWATRM
ncbi:MAG: hypothetical protein QJR03_15275 [Sphaerobacter sp.]|nr:hypothetical protein [Sphaerobacter sp.]